MAIQASELKFYKPAVITDGDTNGGRMSANAATTGVKNNIFPDVSQAERTAGLTRYRKVFFKVESAEDLALLNARIFIEKHTPGEDRVNLVIGTQSDTQLDLTGTERVYGAGQLKTDITAGAGSCVVISESTDVTFVDGDLIRISDMDAVMSG
jgi:hypothetical protein